MSDNKEMKHPHRKGHGHVTPRPDGVRYRCGGPALCRICQAELEAKQAPAVEAKRGTSAQIKLERQITCESIDGAMAFGYQGTNPPPSDDHWLAPYWKHGARMRELERESAQAGNQLHTECPMCKGTGMLDTGGFQPWGESILEPCVCAQPARAALARASEAAAGEPIYQARQHSDEEGTWDDVQEATYLVCAAEPRFYKTRIVYAAPQPAAPSAAAHAPGCGDGEDCNACDAMNVAAAPQPASEPKIVSLYSTGGTTGYSDYLMTDGSVKTLKVSKIKSADWAQPVSEQQGPKQDDEVEFAARQYEGVPLEVARGLARAAIDASNDERQAVRGLSDEIHARLSNPLTAYGMLVRSLRIVAGTTLYDMAKALLTTPAKLSSMELGRSEVTPEFAFDVAAYFDALGVAGTLPAIQAAILAAKGDGHADK